MSEGFKPPKPEGVRVQCYSLSHRVPKCPQKFEIGFIIFLIFQTRVFLPIQGGRALDLKIIFLLCLYNSLHTE